jgi:thymidylate synthase
VREHNQTGVIQKVVVFQQQGSGERKIKGIRTYGAGSIKLEVVSIDEQLPPVIDDGSEFLPKTIDADLVLDFLKHQDLSYDLVELCHRKNIPVISSGKKITSKWVHTPPT